MKKLFENFRKFVNEEEVEEAFHPGRGGDAPAWKKDDTENLDEQ